MGPDPAGLTQIEDLVARLIGLSVPIAFVSLVVVLVWAGIRYLTSGGESKAIQSATMTVTWGLLGILFLAISWLILQLIANFTGIDLLTQFNIRVLCVPVGPGATPIAGCP